LNRAIEIKPGLVESYYNRGVAYIKPGNNNLAVNDLIAAAKLGDERARALLKRNGISW
jgi:hypothetical protein